MLRHKEPIVIKPKGLSDARDGTNAFPGAMTLLQNLVTAYHTDGVFVPRPAAVPAIDFTNFFSGAGAPLSAGSIVLGSNTISSTLLDLNFSAGTYFSGGANYALTALPGYTYSRTGAVSYYNGSNLTNTIDNFAAGAAPVVSHGVGYEDYGALTNLQTYSQQPASWLVAYATNVANGVAVAPDGTTTAGSIIETTANTIHIATSNVLNIAGYLPYTSSVYAKLASGTRYVQLALASDMSVTFNLSTGTIAGSSSGSGNVTGYIINCGNGWYRLVVTYLARPFVNACTIVLSNGVTTTFPSYAGDGTSGIYVWQAQTLLGSFTDGGPIIATTTTTGNIGVPVMSMTCPNGVFTATYTFDDNSTQTIQTSITANVFTMPTVGTLRRPIVKHVVLAADFSRASVGFVVSGIGIPSGTTMTAVSSTSITMSANATLTNGVVLSFGSVGNPNGVISEMLVVGSRVYGMVSSAQIPGYDEPFCYDFTANSFITIVGVNSSLLPLSQNSTGDWVPPVMRAITNSYILATHPGFPGGGPPGIFFGWIDTSSYSQSVIGQATNGSNVITSLYTTVGNSAPILQGVQPGQLINNANFPVGTYVISCINGTFSLNTTGNTNGSTSLTSLASTTGVLPGMTVSGPGIPPGTYVTAVSGATVTMSQAAIATSTGVAINFAGGGSITVSANATATATNTTVNITGGTPLSPRWGAGNFNSNPISTIPKAIYGFNSRTYMGSGPFLVFSDPLMPLQVSAGSQALLVGDGTDITALSGVPLSSQYTGGVQQSMTVFKGAGTLYQVTGDAAAGNFSVNGASYNITGGTATDGGLTINAVAGSVGTLSPRSIVGTPNGTMFLAVDGLRLLSLVGSLSEPLNTYGRGVATPFLNALYQSRVVAAYAENIYRVTTQDASQQGNPLSEYWFDINEQVWTGPHTIPNRAAQPYSSGASFLIAPFNVNGQIWRSDAIPNFNSSYVENGSQIQCQYRTVLLPDNQQSRWNKAIQGTLTMSLNVADSVSVEVDDDRGNILGTCSFNGVGGSSFFREYFLPFPNPLVFRQAKVSAVFQAAAGQAIGNLYVPVQPVNMNDV